MNNIIVQMLDFFGLNTVPTDFPGFITWFFSVCAGIYFLKFCIALPFSFIKKLR